MESLIEVQTCESNLNGLALILQCFIFNFNNKL